LFYQVRNHLRKPEGRVVGVARHEALRPHPPAQALGVSGQPGEGNADVGVLPVKSKGFMDDLLVNLNGFMATYW
jgi:hypothetical protein